MVRTCVENRLDLPSIRHTLRELDLPVEMSEQIESLKLAALPALDQACWDAFRKLDATAGSAARRRPLFSSASRLALIV